MNVRDTAIWVDAFDYGRVISTDIAPVDTPAGFAAIIGRLDTLFQPAAIIVPLDFLLPAKIGSAQTYVATVDVAVQDRVSRQLTALFSTLPPKLAAKAVPQLPGPADLVHGLMGDDSDDTLDDAGFALTDLIRALSGASAPVVLIRDQHLQIAQLCGSMLNIVHDQGKKAALRGGRDAAFDLSFPAGHAAGDLGEVAADGAVIVTIAADARPEAVLAGFAALRLRYEAEGAG